MRLIDANILVYAGVESMPHHAVAKAWLDRILNDVPRVGLPWQSILAYVRIVSNPRIFERPSSIYNAWVQVTSWLESSCAWIPQPTDRHPEVMQELLSLAGLSANHVPDAQLAGIAIEHGLVVCTTDNDFMRFPNVRVENPLH